MEFCLSSCKNPTSVNRSAVRPTDPDDSSRSVRGARQVVVDADSSARQVVVDADSSTIIRWPNSKRHH